MCDNRGDKASAQKINGSEHKAVQRRNHDPRDALHVVACSESKTPDHQPCSRPAKVRSKPVEDEGPLQFLLNPAGHNGRKDKECQLLGRLDVLNERILFGVEAGR